jgi:DnaK suppressor protein
LEDEGRQSAVVDVDDHVGQSVSDEIRDEAFQTGRMEWDLLKQVQDALERIKNGSYGRCLDCGQLIDEARLEAVPWTPYCWQDQQKRDREEAEKTGIAPPPADKWPL